MNHYDAKVFGDNVRGVFDALGGRAPGDKGLEMWFHALKQFPMEHVTDALDEWTRKMPRVPTPAGIADICYERGIKKREDETARWREEEKLAPRTMGATPAGRKALALIKQTLAQGKQRDPLDWARRIMDLHARGEAVSYAAVECASAALGVERREAA